jgi:glyoxylase-like metal-dependent hydrolase (beta-lactamase superfamily II)
MSSLQYPFAEAPGAGSTLEVAAGVRWISMPLPFQLDHINLWWIADTIIDTGIGDETTRGLWEKILPGKQVTRVILTHYHPDHAGNAAWLCEKFGPELWTTQGEYLTAHAVRTASAGYTTDAVLSVFRKNGLDAERATRMAARGNRYAELVPEFPLSYRRIIEGDLKPQFC